MKPAQIPVDSHSPVVEVSKKRQDKEFTHDTALPGSSILKELEFILPQRHLALHGGETVTKSGCGRDTRISLKEFRLFIYLIANNWTCGFSYVNTLLMFTRN